ncbi:unnamed protein product [Rhizopus stolonifer]
MSNSQLQRKLQFQKLYRMFLRTGYTAVEKTALNQKPQVKALIRRRFEKYKYCNDPSILKELKPKVMNTLEFLSIAAKRNGIERNVILNLCSLKRHYDYYEIR